MTIGRVVSMIIKRFLSVGAAVAVTAAMGVTVSPPAATAAPVWKIEKANPGISKEMLDSLPDVVKNSSVTIDPSYKAGTPIVYLDGSPVPGQKSTAKVATASSCPAYGTVVAPGTGAWSGAGGCGVFGNPNCIQGYAWDASPQVYTKGCVQGRGFNSSKTKTWYAIGCGLTGGGTVPWGNVLAMPAVRAQSLSQLVSRPTGGLRQR